FDSPEYCFEVKHDGVRALAAVDETTWRVWGRERADYTARYPELDVLRLYFSQAIIWVKEHPVLTPKDFMGNHEWCFYGWREGAAHQGSRRGACKQNRPSRTRGCRGAMARGKEVCVMGWGIGQRPPVIIPPPAAPLRAIDPIRRHGYPFRQE